MYLPGVASAMVAVETMPTGPPMRLRKSSAIVSILGSSNEFFDWRGIHLGMGSPGYNSGAYTVSIDVQSIHRRFLAGVKCCCGVRRVGNERIERMGHLAEEAGVRKSVEPNIM